MSFASDDASVMIEENNSVTVRIAKNNLYFFITYYIIYRLSLVSKSAYR